MCEGGITVPVSKPRCSASEREAPLKQYFKVLWKKITNAIDVPYVSVNMCLSCGDLEIDGEWQRMPHQSRMSLKKATDVGGIHISGFFKICEFCAYISEEKKKIARTLLKGNSYHYQESFNIIDTIVPESSMSF